MLCRKAGKKFTDENNSATFYVWNSKTVHNLLFVFTNSARMNWWGFPRLATDLLGREGGGGKGNPNLPLPYLKFPPPQTFLASHPESRFSLCSLPNLEYCCVISPYSPLLLPISHCFYNSHLPTFPFPPLVPLPPFFRPGPYPLTYST